ncbi:Ger(x)C family spore germination protein [Schinkia sp. CFF1]
MKRENLFCWLICLPLLFTTGCWDRRELNDRAIWLATGWDSSKKGIEISGQIVVPTNIQSQGGGGSGGTGGGGGGALQPYFTLTKTGENVGDVLDKMQTELSREAFFSQRRVIFLGEEFARKGLKNTMDVNNRKPDIGIRTDIFVVKGSTAKKALDTPGGYEKTPAIAALKKHEQFGGRGETSYLEFLIAANTEGVTPTIPAIEIDKSKVNSNHLLRIAGLAIFNEDLKLLGYIDAEEKRDFLWLLGDLNKRTVWLAYEDGNASMDLSKLKSKIVPYISKNGQIKLAITLKGIGDLFENNTPLNLDRTKNIKFMEKEFEKHLEKQILQTIHKVQSEFGVDIFGFGNVVHQKHPIHWKSLQDNWNKRFAEADISVKVDITIKHTGLAGPPILLKESEIKQ